MNKLEDLLHKLRFQSPSWVDLASFFETKVFDLNPFLLLAHKITQNNFPNILKIYNPSKQFPAISVTGSECALHCEHCNEKYLKGMKPVLTNKDLETFLMQHYKNGGVGVLISGGCKLDGSVPLMKYLDTIKKIKKKTDLIINTHTGLINKKTAKKLADAKVDIVSFDINLDYEIIKEIYHLDKTPNDYKQAMLLLKKFGLNVVPHICIGLHYGKLHKELEAIKFLKETDFNPSLIVLIALIPPKRSKLHFDRPSPSDIAKVIAAVRFTFPKTEISLGCMRPRKNIKVEVEKYAIKAGINRIELPSPDTLKWLKQINPKIQFKYFSACCAIPSKYEDFAKSKDSDIKRYLSI